ncbi:MAG: hypothetical protein E7459_07015 [Ruminococcaceae bacterium]|nr:hypothetical protein [Oscillospiraceae bacterium]
MTYINGVVSTQNNYNSRGLLASVTRAGYYDDDGVSTRATQDYFLGRKVLLQGYRALPKRL